MQYANYQPYPYYQNHMQSPQEIKKAHDLKTLQKKSSGLGFYILTYFLSMNINLCKRLCVRLYNLRRYDTNSKSFFGYKRG